MAGHRSGGRPVSAAVDHADLLRFRDVVERRLGVRFTEGRLDELARVLRERMAQRSVHTFASYERQLQREELRVLADRLTVGETYFFRYAGHFRAFADVALPACARANPGRPIRVLSAGCASLQPALELLRQERLADAMDALNALADGGREDPDAQLLRAVLLTNGGQRAEAETLCGELLEGNAHSAGAHYLLALCREHAGDVRGAVDHDEASIALDGQLAMPHLHLGLLARRLGDRVQSRRYMERALTLLGNEDPARLLLFGGGFTRDALLALCRAELRGAGRR